ncbi:diguanylate cyclase [Brevibacillus reuszeri]|uniref:HTH-type transcriptional regulatory protein TyrR n=1 Tax=Brevibacillus reuszeri TaxID=54915 RepID=A0A0K9Z0Y5_9BACL|nr:sigma 54-interacting transcriptional regulator [Brevibacillus reuszeri]KNB74125.1 transcriptional regulator [Brevibacillus reuszeri]MED1856887.1 sigma 54-interacting transcriptional regulator [Brevibacillus reuszeri]GED68363.1 diguanylate cyclase [Brevibacillus reuszeri]
MIDFEAVLGSIYDIVHVTDAEGRTLYCSPKYGEYFGIDPKEMIGKPIEEFYRLGYFAPTITMRVIRDKKKVQTIQTTLRNRRLFVEGTPIWDQDGNLSGVVNTSIDITEQEQLQQELNEVKYIGTLFQSEMTKEKGRQKGNTCLIYRSQSMQQVAVMAEKLAQVDSSMILLGESGVGKGVLAKYIHECSPRVDKPFVHINCGAIPETLLESELFGYEKGAFTGADKDGKAGLIEKANRGTLFLDEIGEMPLALQVKLLTVLQDKTITPVGSSVSREIDVKLITATNKNLRKMVREGKFREDLYYRIHVVPLEIPPLRERREEIPVLIHYFLNVFSQKYCLERKLSDVCYPILEEYDWPGNVRELENVVERLVVTSHDSLITPAQIPRYIHNQQSSAHNGVKVDRLMQMQDAMDEVERQLVQRAFEQHKTTTRIAEALGISQPSASRKVRKWVFTGE